uniref:Poly(A)-specific ribonuclease n=1 Tax=Rhabditophanes sp. KR3021 TaxID=114890 RepID=A0AC35U3M6_9BILA
MFTILALATQIITNLQGLVDVVGETEQIRQQTYPPIRQIRIDGDLILGGVFPVHEKSKTTDNPCGELWETRGVHRVEAMLYAMDMINAKNDFLRGYKLGAHIVDSCSNPAYALNQSLDFVREMIGGSDIEKISCSDHKDPTITKKPKKHVVAVVGASYSSVTVQIANLLRLFRIVQVSPASTNADLSEKSRFEYFARTVPSDTHQVRAMIDIILHFNWTFVSLVYSADEYGELGAGAFKKEARKANICIANEERILSKPELMAESVDNLINKLEPEKEVGARLVVLFVGTEHIPILMDKVSMKMNNTHSNYRNTKNIIWLASESWDRNNDMYTKAHRKWAAYGAIVLMLESNRIPSFEEYYLSLHPGSEKFQRNGWLRELWRQKFNCAFDLEDENDPNRCEDKRMSRDHFSADDKIQFVIEAVYAIAHGLKEMKEQLCPNDTVEHSWISRYSKGPEICDALAQVDGELFYKKYLLNVKFVDLVGKNVHFTKEGDGPAHYTILNYQPLVDNSSNDTEKDDYTIVGKWAEGTLVINESLMFWNQRLPNVNDTVKFKKKSAPISQCSVPCKSGHKKQLIKHDEQCCWACSKCEEYEYLSDEATCTDCGEGRFPTADRRRCYDLATKHLKYMKWDTWYTIIPVIMAVIGIACTIFVIICYIKFSEEPVVKASGRELSYILLFSFLICYCMTFVLVSKPTPFICALKRTGIGFAFSCLYGGMLVKTNRIHRIFSMATMSALRPRFISPISQVFITTLFTAVQLIGTIIWLLIIPPGTKNYHPTRSQVVLICNVPDHHFLYSLTYDAFLLIVCTIYAIRTRKVPENFNETKYIGFSMYTTCVVWISWMCLFFGTGGNFENIISSMTPTLPPFGMRATTANGHSPSVNMFAEKVRTLANMDKPVYTPSAVSELLDHKYGSVIGAPVNKSEQLDGKKTGSNGTQRSHYIMTVDEIKQGKQSKWTELEIHGKVINLSRNLFKFSHLTCLFLNDNMLSKVPPEIARLTNLNTLDLSNNKIRSLPSQMGDLTNLVDLNLSNNGIRVIPYELGKLFRLLQFNLSNNPLCPEQAMHYGANQDIKKLLDFLMYNFFGTMQYPQRRSWIPTRPVDPNLNFPIFTVMCYNVLCDKYATENMYTYCPKWALKWSYRKRKILDELEQYNCDILTLQEVETEQFHAFFYPELEALGYEGIFESKSRSRALDHSAKIHVDGCAIFWKKDKFELDYRELIEFSQVAADSETNEAFKRRVQPKDNIALIAVLKMKQFIYFHPYDLPSNLENTAIGEPIIVSTAHIHWDPEYCDVKVIQTMMLTNELYRILNEVAKKYNQKLNDIPMVMSGDMNSLPESGVVEFLTNGKISRMHEDLKTFATSQMSPQLDSFSAKPIDPRCFYHLLNLANTFNDMQFPWTNYTADFKGNIDYIFATPNSLLRYAMVEAPDIDWVNSYGVVGFPHPHIPSDHIPIMASFTVRKRVFNINDLVPKINPGYTDIQNAAANRGIFASNEYWE